MDEEEIALNDARRVDQRHRRQAEHAELADCWGDEGVGGVAFGVGRAFRPAPRLTDDSMVFFRLVLGQSFRVEL